MSAPDPPPSPAAPEGSPATPESAPAAPEGTPAAPDSGPARLDSGTASPDGGTAPGPGPACPGCGEAVDAGARFCEACGSPLVPATATVVAAPPAGACAACGATDGYDPDGFCLACGRRSVRPRDHMETDLVWLVGVTDKGPQKARNEDAYALAALPGGGMAVSVCDGVSNIPRSDEASQGACDAAVAVLAEAGGDATLALGAGAAAASAYVVGLGRTAVGAEPPSCTFLALTWRPGQPVSIGWIGDCRAYWVDDDGARRLTTDHSWGTEQVSAGLLSQDEADRDERSHAITRWLGADARGEPVPDVVQFEVGPGQRGAVVALSDGAWNYLSGEAELARLVDVAGLTGGSHRPLDAARRIVDHAIAGGGHDNITAALALIPPAGPHDSTDATEA